jgi:hypothetical protein
MVIGSALIAIIAVARERGEQTAMGRATLVGCTEVSVITLESPLTHACARLTVINGGAPVSIVTIEAVGFSGRLTESAGNVA